MDTEYAVDLLQRGDEAELARIEKAKKEDSANIYLLMSDAFAFKHSSEGSTREERLRPALLRAAMQDGVHPNLFSDASIFRCRDASIWWAVAPRR